jgi:iron(III) transport system substrate-binding protein
LKTCIKAIHSCIVIILISLLWGCGGKDNRQSVVVYVSEDQVFSEPILKDFERETGIRVKALFDTEEAKGTGILNRLLAEKNNPQADVYWANEPLRAEVLKQLGITIPYLSPEASDIPARFKDPDSHWTGFSARVRVLAVNKGAIYKPSSILDYTDPRWKGKAVIANPLFGTTAVQISALDVLWGEGKTTAYLDRLKNNDVKMSTNNGESADLVASGEFEFALVDSDDAINRIRQGKPIEMVFPDQKADDFGALVLPNAVMLIKGVKNPDNGRKLIDYLLTRETERKLAFADCTQIPLHPDVETPSDVPRIDRIKTMPIHYSQVASKHKDVQLAVKDFLDRWQQGK